MNFFFKSLISGFRKNNFLNAGFFKLQLYKCTSNSSFKSWLVSCSSHISREEWGRKRWNLSAATQSASVCLRLIQSARVYTAIKWMFLQTAGCLWFVPKPISTTDLQDEFVHRQGCAQTRTPSEFSLVSSLLSRLLLHIHVWYQNSFIHKKIVCYTNED